MNRAQVRLRVKQWIAHTCIEGAVRGIDRDIATVATNAMIRALSGQVAPPPKVCPMEGCEGFGRMCCVCEREERSDWFKPAPKRRGQ